ncbi:MAG: peptide-methionine (S)-S-oxide reductase MsrA [Acetobacteraceae bacterium]|nr:peptide-methionine (S)-S-oxide reductase MsrA [Acetobacteraceae bacterium]MBV8588662.1 peptide-methionine (S)-S-oxide reductase MsrA [Acetobacteraceae bacterium]
MPHARSAQLSSHWLRTGLCGGAVLAALAGSLLLYEPSHATDKAQRLPPPTLDARQATHGLQTTVLAGGCFWGVQGVFEHVRGVESAVAGYAGGTAETANYEAVSTGATGHAEAVRITYDPAQISYGEILHIFFSVALDPTEVNRQGPDVGTQYRSEIFTTTPEQAEAAGTYIAQLDRANVFSRPIATRVAPLTGFYPAEAYHQDYLVRHPANPYIVINDLPKVRELQHLFPERYIEEPVLALPSPA